MSWFKRHKDKDPRKPKYYYLECPPALAKTWPQLLQAEGLEVEPGPGPMQVYRDGFAKGIPQELGIPPPTKEEIERIERETTRIICRHRRGSLLLDGGWNDESGKYQIDLLTGDPDSPKDETLALRDDVEQILIRHGARIVDPFEEHKQQLRSKRD